MALWDKVAEHTGSTNPVETFFTWQRSWTVMLIDKTMAAEDELTGDEPEDIKKDQEVFCSARISFPICFTVFFFRYFFRSWV